MFEFLITLLFYAAVSVGVSYLAGMLLAPSQPENQEESESGQSRLWNPHTTQQEGLARPRGYGKNLHHGNIINTWTDVIDDREVLYLLIDHGDGPTKGIWNNQVYLNDQLISNLSGASYQERLGTMNQTVMTGFEKLKLEYDQKNREIKFGEDPIIITTPNSFFDDIEFTLYWPNGLFKRYADGGVGEGYISFSIYISEQGEGIWTELFDDEFSKNTQKPFFKKYSASVQGFNCERGKQYDLKFENLSPVKDKLVRNIYIRSIREVVETEFTHPGKALVGIKTIATSQLSGNVDVKIIREDRIINVWDGSEWTLEYSNNRSMVAWDMATLPAIDGDGDGTPYEIVRYDGINPQYLDLEFFHNWADFCEDELADGYGGVEDRCPCNTIVDEFTNIFDLIYKIAAIGHASIYWRGHQLTGWVDDVVTTPIDLVTMDSMMHKTWKNSWAIKDELAGIVEVFYKDEKQGFERTSADKSSGDPEGFRDIVTLEGVGLITRGSAIHYANYLIERNRLICNKNSFRVHKDGFRYKLGETIRLQCRIANWGKAFRVVSSTADTITVDRDASLEISAGDALHIRTYDTILKTVITDTYEVDSVVNKVITATINWAVTPIKGNLVAVGKAGDIKERRIIRITPTIDNFFNVEVETYNDDLFDIDNLDPDNPNVDYIWPGALSPVTPPITREEVIDLISQHIQPQPDVEVPSLSNIEWTGDIVAKTVTWAIREADEPITFSFRGVTYEIDPAHNNDTTDEFIYWTPGFTDRFRTTPHATTALAPGCWLICTNKEGVAYPVNAQQLMHCAILLAGTLRAETYLELRNTYVYNGDDSLDKIKSFEIPFKIVSEMIAIKSVKLSFKLMAYRAYSTGAVSGGGGIETSEPGGGFFGWSTEDAESGVSIDSTNLGSHDHTTYGHSHEVAGRTESEDGTGDHDHDISRYRCDTLDSDADVNLENLGSHSHTLNEPFGGGHSHDLGDFSAHTHDVEFEAHVHGIVYGIHEESNAPNVHFHVDNGGGFLPASDTYNVSQMDIDITAVISGTGWKGIRFDSELDGANGRCRIAAIIECKLDINA